MSGVAAMIRERPPWVRPRRRNSGGERGGFCGQQRGVQRSQEAGAVDGFWGVIVAAGGEAFFTITGHGVGGEGDDASGVSPWAEFARGWVAVEDGHLHIHEDGAEGASLALGVESEIDGDAARSRRG